MTAPTIPSVMAAMTGSGNRTISRLLIFSRLLIVPGVSGARDAVRRPAMLAGQVAVLDDRLFVTGRQRFAGTGRRSVLHLAPGAW
jgi:hypothetical protein